MSIIIMFAKRSQRTANVDEEANLKANLKANFANCEPILG